MLFAAAQHFLDIKNKVKMERRDKSIRQKSREEIIEYGTLKNAWGLEHIEVKISKKECKHCSKKQRYVLVGHYRDYYELTKQSIYLGSSYVTAHSRLNHVKSFL